MVVRVTPEDQADRDKITEILLDVYGDSLYVRGLVIGHLTPMILQVLKNEDFEENGADKQQHIINRIWMNFSGGGVAEYATKRIYEEFGIEWQD